MTERYRVEPTGRGFWPFCVVAGDGTLELFIGHRKSCEQVAAELTTAFMDGEFVGKRDYDALHADAEALRAENGRLRADRGVVAHAHLLRAQIAERELEAARGLLERVHDGLEKGHPLLKVGDEIRAFLTATPAPEVNCNKQLQAAGKPYPRTCAVCGLSKQCLAEQGERQEAVVPDALRKRFSEIEDEVARGKHNAMSCFTAMRTAALYTPQPGPDVLGLVEALEQADDYLSHNKLNEIGSGSILHRAMQEALAAWYQAQ